jgi:hypothetical protein
MPWFVLGDLFYLLSMVLSISLLAIPRLRAYAAIWVSYSIAKIVLTFALLPMGLTGAAIAHAIAAAGLLLVLTVDHASTLSIDLRLSTVGLVASAAIVISIALVTILPIALAAALQSVLILVWVLVVTSREEKALVIEFVQNRVNRSYLSVRKLLHPSLPVDP